jgi:hypothetical protein
MLHDDSKEKHSLQEEMRNCLAETVLLQCRAMWFMHIKVTTRLPCDTLQALHH